MDNRVRPHFLRQLRWRDPDTGYHLLPSERRSGDWQLFNPKANYLPVRLLGAWLQAADVAKSAALPPPAFQLLRGGAGSSRSTCAFR
jgi:hypothetical protein